MNDGGMALQVEGTQQTALEMQLAKTCGDTLLKHYPGYLWAVTVNKGLIQVVNLNLSGRWGFVIRSNKVYSASELDRQLRTAGGEILERYRITRAKLTPEGAASKVMANATDFAGNTRFDREDLRIREKPTQ